MRPPKKGTMPEAAQKALRQAGVDVAAIACFDKKGEMHILRASDVNDNDTVFPITTTAIEDITPISAVRHKGSTCTTIVVNGVATTYCW